jgi:hypothetical protein
MLQRTGQLLGKPATRGLRRGIDAPLPTGCHGRAVR